jgi:endonuclease III related protein
MMTGGFFLQISTGQKLMEMFNLMQDRFGSQDWWPGDTELEMMVGAILTQNTSWKNVDKAIANLKNKGLLDIERLHSISPAALAEEIRPAGYFNIKSVRLKNLINFLVERYERDMSRFLSDETEALREGLLSVKGVGPETADSILLYAVKRPVFVIDAYTYRILHRHGLIEDQVTYDELKELFESNLPADESLFNEFHALIVRTAKEFCKGKPLCEACPLHGWASDI